MGWRWGPVVAARGYERARQRAQRAPHLVTTHQQALCLPRRMQGLVVGPKIVVLEAVGTATADLHVLIAGEDGQVPLAEVELLVMAVVAVVEVVC